MLAGESKKLESRQARLKMLAAGNICFVYFAILIATGVCGETPRRGKSTTKAAPRLVKRIAAKTVKPSTPSTRANFANNDSPYPFCKYYHKVKKELLDATMQDEFISGVRDMNLELVDRKDNRAMGTIFFSTSGKYYFQSLELVRFKTAVTSCLLRKMQLVAIDTPQDRSDLYTTYARNSPQSASTNEPFYDDTAAQSASNDNLSKNIEKVYMGQTGPSMDNLNYLWTSAVPCSKSDPLDKKTNSCSSVTWCSSKVETRLDYALKLGKAPPPYCLALNKTSMQLQLVNCSLKATVLCELACSRPNCPSVNQCKKDDSLFEVEEGKTFLKGNEIRGSWEQTANISYFLGEKLVSWSENWRTCCSLGLKPIAVRDELAYFEEVNPAAMQGLLFWTAMTREACAFSFGNCFHNISQPMRFNLFGFTQGGSCVAITYTIPAPEYGDQGDLMLGTSVCSTKYFLACEGPEKTFEIKEEKNNCELPKCSGIPECILDDALIIKKPRKIILAPESLGNWFSACGNRLLELPNQSGSWDEAYKRCCSYGMDLLSIYNGNKHLCLDNPSGYSSNDKAKLPFSGQYWTSGRDLESCRGQLRWCTSYLNDFLKSDLVWKAGQTPGSANNSCVFVEFNGVDLPSLGLADCSEKKQIFCEAPSEAGAKSTMHASFCRKIFNVKETEAKQIWNTGDLSRTSYGAKQMIQCLAEFTGLVYNSTKINKQQFMDMTSRIVLKVDVKEINSALNETNSMINLYMPIYGYIAMQTARQLVNRDVWDKIVTDSLQININLIKNFFTCRNATAQNNDATFAFDFFKCLLRFQGMEKFWRSYGFDLERFSVLPMEEEFNSPCRKFTGLLVNTSLCIADDFYSGEFPLYDYTSPLPVGVEKLGTSSLTACLERRGSLPYADTKEQFAKIYKYIRDVSPNLVIIWDQAYVNNGNSFMWCRSNVDPLNPNARIPVPVRVKVTTQDSRFMLVSMPGTEPNLQAVPVTDELLYQTDVYCRFSESVVNECDPEKSILQDVPRWEY